MKEENAAEDFYAAFWTDMCSAVRQTLASDGNALAQGKFYQNNLVLIEFLLKNRGAGSSVGISTELETSYTEAVFFSRRILLLPGQIFSLPDKLLA